MKNDPWLCPDSPNRQHAFVNLWNGVQCKHCGEFGRRSEVSERKAIVREMLPQVLAAYMSVRVPQPEVAARILVQFMYFVADEFTAQGAEDQTP